MSARPSWAILGPGLVVVLAAVALLAKGLYLDPHEIRSPLISKPAPRFELPRLSDGSTARTADLLGKPSVVNFWATWCDSCEGEHPMLVELNRVYGERVHFVSIVYNDKNERIEGWLARHGGATYPTLIDINGKAAIAYGVYGVPETYVLDSVGIIRHKHTGLLNPQELRVQLEGLL
jgi:cytochrome c biogenesis protein CcmG/thiol:disulfide interchange protein DsbE